MSGRYERLFAAVTADLERAPEKGDDAREEEKEEGVEEAKSA